MATLGASAVAYARRGMKVFPLKPGGKTPLTAHGFKDASSDIETVRAWWAAHPDANIGIATGAGSGVWVLDVDYDKGGRETLRGLLSGQEPLPLTPVQTTGNGRHYLWVWPAEGGIANSAGRLGAGLDTRGEGGYIVAAPSIHPSGAAYAWTGSKAAIAPAPEWLLALCRKPAKPAESVNAPKPNFATIPEAYGRKALELEYAAVAGAGEGTRNAALNTAAFNMGTLAAVDGVKWSDVSATLEAAAQANGYAAEEGHAHVELVIKSGFEAGMQHPREVKPSNLPPRGQRPRLAAVEGNLALAPDPIAAPGLTLNAKGAMKANSIRNAIAMLLTDPELAGLFVLNDFTAQLTLTRRPPWTVNGHAGGALTDADVTGCASYLERIGLTVTLSTAYAAIQFVGAENHINPVRDYMAGLVWDGRERLADWLCDYMDAPQTAFVRTVAAKWMIGAAARVMRPGTKVDTMLILEGPQGLKKSTALEALATIGGEVYFADKLPALDSKDAALEIQGRIIVEIAELDALRKAEVSQIKAYLSQRIDRFRPPYGRCVVERPRQCVFAGTVNPGSAGYLADPTGGRRFWPVAVHHINLESLQEAAPQLWAEAVHLYQQGHSWWLDEDTASEAREQQRERYDVDVWAEKIDEYVLNKERVKIADVLADKLELPKHLWTMALQKRVGAHLRFTGWQRKKWHDPMAGKPVWVFEREEE